jgi:predicted ABC-type exoprotein transport system permease subunit
MDAGMKAYIISALIIGLMASLLICIIWVPLVFGCQQFTYSEPSYFISIFEFGMAVVGLVFIGTTLYKVVKR